MTTPDPPAPKEPAQRTYREILLNEVGTGLAEFRRPAMGLFLSSLSGGLDVSFSLLLMATVSTLLAGTAPEPVERLAVAAMYSVGFIFVVVGRSELFTEHTSRAMFPVLGGQADWFALARLWALVYCGNLVGIAAFTWVVVLVGPRLDIIHHGAFAAMSRPLIERSWWLGLVSAGLAGWLMGLLSWLVSACRDTISQIVIVGLVATSIGLARLPHAIVGSGEVFSDILAGGQTTWREFGLFVLLTTLGNGLGGAVFVALLKHGHSMRSAEEVA